MAKNMAKNGSQSARDNAGATGAFDRRAVERARRRLGARLPDERAQELSRMFAAFGDATRLKLLHALSGGEMCVGDLSVLLEVSASAVSHQLSGLRALRLVKARRAGKRTLYSLDDDHVLTLLDVGLEHARESPASPVRRVRPAAVATPRS